MSRRYSQEQYRRLRESFDELQIQDQALFLVEAAVSTLARGIEQAGETLADEVGDVFRGGRRSERRGRSSNAANPSTSERQAPHRRHKPETESDPTDDSQTAA